MDRYVKQRYIKSTKERYKDYVRPAVDIIGCFGEAKELGLEYDEFVELVATRMDAMDRLYCKHSPVSRRIMQRDGVWDENISPCFGRNIGYEEALALAAVQLEIIVQVAERFGLYGGSTGYIDSVMRQYLRDFMYGKYEWRDAGSVIRDQEELYEWAMSEARELIYNPNGDEDDEEWDYNEESEEEK